MKNKYHMFLVCSELFPLPDCMDSDSIAMLRTTVKVLYDLLPYNKKPIYSTSLVYTYEARSVLVLLATAPKGSNKIALNPPTESHVTLSRS